MRTTKIIIYPLILMLLFPVAAFAAEIPETVAQENQEGNQEEVPVVEEIPIQEPEQVPEPEVPESVPESIPETTPSQEPETELPSESETQLETVSETETETELETETEETQETLLDEDTKGLLKEYLSNAVSGNSTAEAPVEPENTEYQTYIQEALQVLQDNSTTQINVMLAICGFIVIVVGLVTGLLLLRRMR